MVINNALVGGELKSIIVENGIIKKIGEVLPDGDIDAKGKRVIPGLIDVHSHGCLGIDTMDADFEKMSAFYAENGTTTWYPTTMTQSTEALKKVCAAPRNFKGANMPGLHFEGPYISAKYKGAQNEEYIKSADINEFNEFSDVKLITLAPEEPGNMEFIEKVSKNCVVVLGHTDCDYETALEAIDKGANCLTHTFNAMPPLRHRAPGPIGAAVEKHIYAQVICDGFHVMKPVVIAAYKMFGADRMVIISDSICCAGMPDGKYICGGLEVFLKNGEARLADGTVAGSVATLMFCVKKAVSFGIPFEDAVRMASETPAEMMGLNKGRVAEGYDADLLIIDDDMNIETVIIGGEIFKN